MLGLEAWPRPRGQNSLFGLSLGLVSGRLGLVAFGLGLVRMASLVEAVLTRPISYYGVELLLKTVGLGCIWINKRLAEVTAAASWQVLGTACSSYCLS